ncbi:DEAD/DEAH box helicase [Marinobacterium sp. BA1]|uniref:DEAD/DEAH box helicase n=1 Tax=Marinobacterium sp. BA1 TaxID=3138931 RepID=UPI0032E74BE5
MASAAEIPQSENTIGRLSAFGVDEPWKVALLLPRRWDDFSVLTDSLHDMSPESSGALVCRVVSQPSFEFQKGPPRANLLIEDGRGVQASVTLFGDTGQARDLVVGKRYLMKGKTDTYNGQLQFRLDEVVQTAWAGRARPVYPGKSGVIGPDLVRQRQLALLPQHMTEAAEQVIERLAPLGDEAHLLQLAKAAGQFNSIESILWMAHLPETITQGEQAHEALERLAAADMLLRAREEAGAQVVREPLLLNTQALEARTAALPYPLTDEQSKAVTEITEDLRRPVAMRRLLSGDVGTGKTAVYGTAVAVAADAGARCVVMLPNINLATQVFREMAEYWPDLDIKLVSGDTKKRENLRDTQVLVGTTALLNRAIGDRDLVVADEQHKFSKAQREKMAAGGGHLLEVSATSIPRSQALLQFGVMDLSMLTKGHVEKTLHTRLRYQEDRAELFQDAIASIEAGHQLAVVYPLKENQPSGDDAEPVSEADERKSAITMYESWEKRFPGRVRLLHGQMSDQEKQDVIADMKADKADILISTTVIEVGLTLPRLRRLMVISADRHGLTGLHQLRGRLARHGGEGYFDLYIPQPKDQINPATIERLSILEQTTDGFTVAEHDMTQRGYGELTGEKQSGKSDGLLLGRSLEVSRLTEMTAALPDLQNTKPEPVPMQTGPLDHLATQSTDAEPAPARATIESVSAESEVGENQTTDSRETPSAADTQAQGVDMSDPKPAWELTREAWVQQAIARDIYADAYMNDDSLRGGYIEGLERRWFELLMEHSSEGRISNVALDDLVSREGYDGLRSFIGVHEKGVEGYLMPDFRLWEKTYSQMLSMHQKGELGPTVRNVREFHRMAIENALRRGETLPEAVLKDYPQYAQAQQSTGDDQDHMGMPMEKQPWEMTRKEWESEREKVRPNTGQTRFTKHSANEAVRNHERLMFLTFSVTEFASDQIRKAANGDITLSPEELETLDERIKTPVHHRDVIEKALAEGLPVPQHIQDEYPDLRPGSGISNQLAAVESGTRDGATSSLNETGFARMLDQVEERLALKPGALYQEYQSLVDDGYADPQWVLKNSLYDQYNSGLEAVGGFPEWGLTPLQNTLIDARIQRIVDRALNQADAGATHSTEQVETAPNARGDLTLTTGERVKLPSGAVSSAVPKLDFTNERRSHASMMRMHAWLLENAITEAAARGDTTNLAVFEQSLDARNLSAADIDSLNMYLFDRLAATQIQVAVEDQAHASVVKPSPEPVPAAELRDVAVMEPVKWFGSNEKATGWVARQSDPAQFDIVASGNSRFEIFKRDAQQEVSASTAAPAPAAAEPAVKVAPAPVAAQPEASAPLSVTSSDSAAKEAVHQPDKGDADAFVDQMMAVDAPKKPLTAEEYKANLMREQGATDASDASLRDEDEVDPLAPTGHEPVQPGLW